MTIPPKLIQQFMADYRRAGKYRSQVITIWTAYIAHKSKVPLNGWQSREIKAELLSLVKEDAG